MNDRTKFGAKLHLSRDVDDSEMARLNVQFLRRLYPTNTRDSVARDTRIPPATVKRWLEEYSPPSWRSVCRLTNAYGNDWLLFVFGGLTLQNLEDKNNELERKRAQLEAEQAKLDRELADYRHARNRHRASVVARSR